MAGTAMQSLLLLLPVFSQLAHAVNVKAKRATSPTQVNNDVARDLGILWAALLGAFIVYHFSILAYRYSRTRAAKSDGATSLQRYARPNPAWSWVKQHFFAAPLFTSRRSREVSLGKRFTLGFLPSRVESFAIGAYIAVNIILAFTNIPWNSHGATAGGLFRNRLGTLAAMNLLPLVVFASRNNPLITLLGIKYSTYNLMHRWIGRIVAIEALMHGLTEIIIVAKFMPGGHMELREGFKKIPFFQEGLAGLVAAFLIVIFSSAVFRRAFYETFLHLHQLLAILFLGAIWLHTKAAKVWQNHLIIAAVALWAAERFLRLCRIAYRNFNLTGTQHITRCDVVELGGDAVRVTVRLARPMKLFPGQHAFLYIPAIGMHTCHPFSLAWGPRADDPVYGQDLSRASASSANSVGASDSDVEKGEKLSATESNDSSLRRRQLDPAVAPTENAVMTFIIRRRSGFTSRLHRKATETTHKTMNNLVALVEGPYASESLSSYGTVLLIAGGVGITHHLLQVKTLLREIEQGKCAARRIVLVWMVQTVQQFSWIESELTDLLNTKVGREALRVNVYVTRPSAADKEVRPQQNLHLVRGSRPDVGKVIDEVFDAQSEQSGAAVVSVCGAGGLSDNVRAATRKLMKTRAVDFSEASFGW